MQDPTELLTLSAVMDDLNCRGFTEHFTPAEGKLRAVVTQATFAADQLVIAECHRFEGVSDPDDMSIVYALEAGNGIRGTLVDAFGVYSDPRVGAFMGRVPFRTAS
jgi:hypothetical protein